MAIKQFEIGGKMYSATNVDVAVKRALFGLKLATGERLIIEVKRLR